MSVPSLYSPVPRIRWRKVDTSQNPQWFSSDPVLHIQSVSFDDDGTYECEAENFKGRDTHQGRVIVQGEMSFCLDHTNINFFC